MDDELDRDAGSENAAGPLKEQNHSISVILKLLAGLAVVAIAIFALLPAVGSRPATSRNQCGSQLKQIAHALQSYAAEHGGLPPAYTTDADGKPLHSWRTLILPYMEERRLYDAIDLTKAWDDPANAVAFNTKIEVYRCPEHGEDDNRTTYLAVVTPTSCFRATEPGSLSEITDDPTQTLLVIDVDEQHTVPWMAPVDADEGLVLGLASESSTPHLGGIQVVFVDGRVRFLKFDLSDADRRALISKAGNDKVAAEIEF